jgi:hypothetical protein
MPNSAPIISTLTTSDRGGDAEAGEDRRPRARPDHPAHDGPKRHVETLRHADQVARHLVDAAIDRDRGGKEHAQRGGSIELCRDPDFRE